MENHDILPRYRSRNAKCATLSQFSEWVGILSSASNFLHEARVILADEGFIGHGGKIRCELNTSDSRFTSGLHMVRLVGRGIERRVQIS
jgi:hypothetical protein